MLESIPAETHVGAVFRMASYRDDTGFMQDEGLDRESVAELTDLLRSCGLLDSLGELCEAPFRPNSKGGFPVTRFSDGSFPVFYCSTDEATAEAEVQHHFCARYSGKPDGRRVSWYQCFVCDFSGSVKDLQPQQAAWSDLTHGQRLSILQPARRRGKENGPRRIARAVGQAPRRDEPPGIRAIRDRPAAGPQTRCRDL